MARAVRYWTNTTGACWVSFMGCFITVLNIREPGGETQTLEPRPRPAIWVVAVAVKPVSRCFRRKGFLCVGLDLGGTGGCKLVFEFLTFRALCWYLLRLHRIRDVFRTILLCRLFFGCNVLDLRNKRGG